MSVVRTPTRRSWGTGARWFALVLLLYMPYPRACAAAVSPPDTRPQTPETRYATWDQFFYKVHAPIAPAAPATEVTLLVYHSYPGPLHDVRIVGHSALLTVTRQPKPLAKLDPTEIVSLLFAVKYTGRTQAGEATLQLELRARELVGAKTVEVTVPLTAQASRQLGDRAALPVGTMEVRVGGFGSQVYVIYLLPSLALLGWWLWRRKRLARW